MRAPAALLHPRELTPSWLTAALDQGGVRGDVDGFRWRRIGQDTGIGGFVSRVELRYRTPPSPDAPSSVVIKFPRWRDPYSVRQAGFERRFYRDHAPECPVTTPRLFYSALNKRARRWTLVVEDLRACRPLDDVVGISAEDAAAVVVALARLHAWAHKAPGLDWVVLSHEWTRFSTRTYERNVEAGLRRLHGFVPRRDLARFRGLADHETAARRLLAAEPQTVCHQDYRGDNLFINQEGHVVVVDWETPWRYRGGAELGRFLVTSLEPDVLRTEGQALIDRYTRALRQNDFQNYSPAEIERDVRLGMLRLMTRSVAQLNNPELGHGRPLRVVRTWAIRSNAAVQHFDAIDAVPADALREAADVAGHER